MAHCNIVPYLYNRSQPTASSKGCKGVGEPATAPLTLCPKVLCGIGAWAGTESLLMLSDQGCSEQAAAQPGTGYLPSDLACCEQFATPGQGRLPTAALWCGLPRWCPGLVFCLLLRLAAKWHYHISSHIVCTQIAKSCF